MKIKRVLAAVLLLCLLLTTISCGRSKKYELVGIKIGTPPTKTEYSAGEEFDTAGMVVLALYSNGGDTGKASAISAYFTDKTVLSLSDTEVTVSYKGFTAVQPITVIDRVLTSISVSSMPNKTVYTDGENFDPDGMTVTARYDNGTEENITDYSVDKTLLVSADKSVTVSYNGFFADVPITVKAKDSLVGIKVTEMPLRTVYVTGECFNPLGLSLTVEYSDKTEYTVYDFRFENKPLAPSDSEITLEYGGLSVSLPIKVVNGKMTSFKSKYSEKEYNKAVENLKTDIVSVSENHFGDGFIIVNRLPCPISDGVVKNMDELVDYADYLVFYRSNGLAVKLGFDFGDLESGLTELCYRSGIILSNCSVDGEITEDGYLHLVFKYYDSCLLNVKDRDTVISEYLGERPAVNGKRKSGKMIDAENGITVYNSEQAAYALSKGYRISPVPGSPAEIIVNRAENILDSTVADSMTGFEKMYALSVRMLENTSYDVIGEQLAGYVLDYERESDMFASLFVSFHAEGSLMYGNSVCYGYAKGMAILLGLEGMNFRRVVGRTAETVGRSAFAADADSGEIIPVITTHSYLYVNIDGYDYICDPTFAYAGSLNIDGNNATWSRLLGIGLSIDDHRQIYKNNYDLYSASEEYRAGGIDYLEIIKDRNGETLLVDSAAELDSLFAGVSDRINNSGSEYFCLAVGISRDCYKNAGIDKISSIIDKHLNDVADSYRYSVGERSMGGKEFFEVLFVLKK